MEHEQKATTLPALTSLPAGMPIIVGGNRVLHVSETLSKAFAPGDAVIALERTGELLHVPQREQEAAAVAVERAHASFDAMAEARDAQISAFYVGFAERLSSDEVWAQIAAVNARDVDDARGRGRSTTRLVASEKMRKGMIDGLRGWAEAPSRRDQVLETVQHEGWRVELVGAPLGVVGFVFEGRPNVVADATGVLRGGNTVVFRIGRDALQTAQSIMRLALRPALVAAGLPEHAVSLVESSAHAAGWAMFGDRRLSLAVARGSGAAVDTLGAIAQQAGVPVSLHGTGGAWIMAEADADAARLQSVVTRSLDRKVCNTLNTLCLPRAAAGRLVPAALAGLQEAAARLDQAFKLHVAEGDEGAVPSELFAREVTIRRAEGDVVEPQAERISRDALGHEWEWEQSPEITLVLVDDVAEGVDLFNRHSPQFVASLVSEDRAAHQRFYAKINAPFVGDGFTRWVDGQYALRRPELGLSNWERGRLFGRAGILSGDTVLTVRTRAVDTDAAP